MPTVSVEHRSTVSQTFRAAKVSGLFDIPRESEQRHTITAELPIEGEQWQVGALVGASGAGKSSLARKAWPASVHTSGSHAWSGDCVLDDFPDDMSPVDITNLLSAVGFSSPPAWLRPYRALSTGQQFRCDLARSLSLGTHGDRAQETDTNEDLVPVVYDEFTSTVDRTVAKAVCVATAKHVRRSSERFVAVTCHRDVLEWLEPDWYYDLDSGEFTWGCQRRPDIGLRIREGARSAWTLFRGHHYLSHELSPSARVFLAFVTLDGTERLAGFCAVLPVAGHKGWWRGHRTVVLPDMQGLGIGNSLSEWVGEILWGEGKRYRSTTSAPGMIAHRRRHPERWRLAQGPGMKAPAGKTSSLKKGGGKPRTSAGRLTTNWVYIPRPKRQ